MGVLKTTGVWKSVCVGVNSRKENYTDHDAEESTQEYTILHLAESQTCQIAQKKICKDIWIQYSQLSLRGWIMRELCFLYTCRSLLSPQMFYNEQLPLCIEKKGKY